MSIDSMRDYGAAVAILQAMEEKRASLGSHSTLWPEDWLGSLIDELAAVPPFSNWKGHTVFFSADGGRGQFGGPRSAIARLLKGDTPKQIVDEFGEIVQNNSATFLSVYLFRGFAVEKREAITEDMWFCPADAAPQSSFNDELFADSRFLQYVPSAGFNSTWGTPKSALVVRHTVTPLAIDTSDVGRMKQVSEELTKLSLNKTEVVQDVHRAIILAGRSACTVPALYHIPEMAANPAPGHILTGFLSDGHIATRQTAAIDLVRELFEKLSTFKNNKGLRIAIDRIAKARLLGDPINAAIDLGMAMEVLLMQGEESPEREINYKISLRAGLLLGSTPFQRREKKKAASELYSARSYAAHTGQLIKLKQPFDVLAADEFVGDIARAVLAIGTFPDWLDLTFGKSLEVPEVAPEAEIESGQ